jgi:hypothetical protein
MNDMFGNEYLALSEPLRKNFVMILTKTSALENAV